MTRKNWYHTAIKLSCALLLSFLVSACSLLFPATPYNPTLYTLNTSVPTQPKTKVNGSTLLVLPVIANQEIDNSRMAYVLQSDQIAYFAKNRWAAPPAEMLQPLIVQALSNTGYYAAVIPSPFTGSVDLRLYTQLQKLQQDFTTQPSQIEMSLSAQIVASATGRVLGSKQFYVVVPAPGNNPESGAQAANIATATILQQLAQFSARVSANSGN